MYLTNRLLRHTLASGDEVWISALTGAVDRLGLEEVRQLESAMAAGGSIDEPWLARLKERGYLFEDPSEEAEAFERLVRDFSSPRSEAQRVTHLIVCPTYTCNLRCVYCFEQRSHPDLYRKPMDLTVAAKVMDAFRRIRSLDPDLNYSLGLFGGEPLLFANRTVVSRFLAYAEAEDLPVMIVTNGVNVSSFMPVLEQYAASIWAVQLTLDGPPGVHDRRRPTASGRGTFNAVAAATDLLLEKGIRVVLRVNIDRSNIDKLPQITEIAAVRGWLDRPSFACSLAPVKDHLGSSRIPDVTPDAELLSAVLDVYDRDPATEDLFGLEGFQSLSSIAGLLKPGEPSIPRVYHCEANYGGFWVAGADGYLYACPESIGQPGLAVGKFVPEFEIWQENLDQWIDRNIQSLPKCRQCDVGPLCGGGCTYASMVRGGDSAQPVCDSDPREAIELILNRRVLGEARTVGNSG
jgi:uncharacterized protein